jgi:hypothetical protein
MPMSELIIADRSGSWCAVGICAKVASGVFEFAAVNRTTITSQFAPLGLGQFVFLLLTRILSLSLCDL